MLELYFALLVLAVVLLFLAAFQVHAPKFSLGWLGLAFFALVPLIQTFEKL